MILSFGNISFHKDMVTISDNGLSSNSSLGGTPLFNTDTFLLKSFFDIK
jgi:hypothetical protein